MKQFHTHPIYLGGKLITTTKQYQRSYREEKFYNIGRRGGSGKKGILT